MAAVIPAAIISKLVRLDLTDEQIDAVASLLEEVADAVEAKAGAAIAARRSADRERKNRQRSGTVSREVTGRHVTDRDSADKDPSPKERSPTPPKEITPTQTLPSVGVRSARDEAFDLFWQAYPAKVGKDAARKSFDKVADHKRVTLRVLLAAIERYRQNKPADREWCNPTTWLNQGRWQDDPPPPAALTRPGPSPPKRNEFIASFQRDREREREQSGPSDHHPDFDYVAAAQPQGRGGATVLDLEAERAFGAGPLARRHGAER